MEKQDIYHRGGDELAPKKNVVNPEVKRGTII